MAIRSVAIRRQMTMFSMPQLVSDDQDSSAAKEVILEVDTHNDVHVAAVITALGVLLGTANFPATAAGYQTLVCWVGTLGMLRRAGVEGTGSYGAALARHLRAAGVEVIEVNAPRQGHLPSAGQDRHPRRRSRRPGSAQRPGQRQREGR
jgi:Transposase